MNPEAPGPASLGRAEVTPELLAAARHAAEQAGMTRLADVTRLDRLGLPVWQAVRPLGKALSVHQGKGRTAADAQLGAMLETLESHAAEEYQAPVRRCAFTDLPPDQRAPDLSDFAADRDVAIDPAEPIDWVAAETMGGGILHLPFDLVSLDFTCGLETRVERASNGVAAGISHDDALLAALHELVERDAVREWAAHGMVARMRSMIEPASVPYAWFGAWRERIDSAGATLRCYAVPSLSGTPVFACEIVDQGKRAAPYRATQGRGAAADPEAALFKALAEAVQSRCTYIAGARDDLLPDQYVHDRSAMQVGLGLPLPPGMDGQHFDAKEGPRSAGALAAAIETSGFGPIAVVRLGQPNGFHIVRAFACGLGSIGRRRRAA